MASYVTLHPDDAVEISKFTTTALNEGANPQTLVRHVAVLQAFSRFGRQNQTREQPFSLAMLANPAMLADPQKKQAADDCVDLFCAADDTHPTYKEQLLATVEVFREGHVRARTHIDPDDAAAIAAYMVTAVNHGDNPITVGNYAWALQALSLFGRQNQTREQPFSLARLVEQKEAADSWVESFRADSVPGKQCIPSAVRAFRVGHGQAREQLHPDDAAAITKFMTTAVDQDTSLTIVRPHIAALQALSRFGRKNQAPERPFSLTMLSEAKQEEAADSWVESFRTTVDRRSRHQKQLAAAVKVFRDGHEQSHQVQIAEWDRKAINLFLRSAVYQGGSPIIACDRAKVLQALAHFGWKKHTLERPFALTMFRFSEHEDATRSWEAEFCETDTGKSYQQFLPAAVTAFCVGSIHTHPDDAAAITTFIISALKQGTNPATAGDYAGALHALSRFGRKTEVVGRLFSLTMLSDKEQEEAADEWVMAFCNASHTSKNHRRRITPAVKAFRAGYAQAREQLHPDDAAAIANYMITAVNQGIYSPTAGHNAVVLQALARFGRKNQTPERSFSLAMLVDPQRKTAADVWVDDFHSSPDTFKTHQEEITRVVKAVRAAHALAGQMPNLNVLPTSNTIRGP